MAGKLIECAPGGEAAALDELSDDAQLKLPGALIVVGERLAGSPGAFSAASRLAAATGARLAWVPRRAGERGAVEAGALPGLLPAGRPLGDASAREQTATAWNVDELPTADGRDTTAILAAARDGELGALLIAVSSLPTCQTRRRPCGRRGRAVRGQPGTAGGAVTNLADVVSRGTGGGEAGSFVNWEGRIRPFAPSLQTNAVPDLRVLQFLADEIGVDLALPNAAAAGDELARLGQWGGTRPSPPEISPERPSAPGSGQAVLASWRMLLDAGRLQDGEPYLAGTAHPPVVRLSAATAGEIGATEGDLVTVSTDRGEITLPLVITEMPDRVAWVPLNSAGSAVHEQLTVTAGAVVSIGRAVQ
jgi:NADH-quinone oxidoreductase subunit G